MGSVKDFVGRRADMLAFQGTFPGEGEQQVGQDLAGPDDGGSLCTGVHKLAQWFLTTLLKERGSDPYRPTDGTAFMTRARQGRWRTVADVNQAFYASLINVRRQLFAAELPDDPDDERLESASLDGVGLAPGEVSLRISLTTKAGAAYQFIAPVQVPIR